MGTVSEAMIEEQEKRADEIERTERFSERWYELMIDEGYLNADGECYLSDGEWVSAEVAYELGLL